MSAKGLAEQGTTYPTREAAQLVNFLIVTGLTQTANVYDSDYETDFRQGVAKVKSFGDPAAVPAVDECVEMVRELAPAYAASNIAAKLFKLYPAEEATKQ